MFQSRFGSFSDLFFTFFKPFPYRFKSFSGAISFCRHAALNISAKILQNFRKNPFANDPISELLTIALGNQWPSRPETS